MPRMLEMGAIGKAHGIKGELSLVWHGSQPPRQGMRIILADSAGGEKSFRVSSLRMHKERPLAMLEGIADRTAAEALQGSKIFVDASSLEAPADDEAWLADLLGMEVCLEDGTGLGKLDHVEFPAGQELWAIVDEKGREILFPAQPCFLVNIDEEQGKIVIRPPEGLLEIYGDA